MPSSVSVSETRQGLLFPIAMTIALAGYLLAVAWCIQNLTFDVWGGLLIAPVLVAAVAPLASKIASHDRDPRIAQIMIAGVVLKLGGSIARYVVADDVYKGVADATVYHEVGAKLAPLFRAGIFEADIGKVVGTGFIKILTGLIYAVIGPSKVGGFLVFSFLGFLGLVLFFRAFVIGVPDGDHRRYAKLIFFLPSLIYWPSSIGKEAWMMLTLGLTAYGAARVLAGRRLGYLLVGAGLFGTAMVRPHVTLVTSVAFSVGYLFRRSLRPNSLSPFAKVLGIGVLAAGSVLVMSQVEDFFGVEKLDSKSVEEVLLKTQGQTSQGRSEFQAPRAASVADVPLALVSILFRPFPFEAHNPQAALASAEGVVVFILIARSRARLHALLRTGRRTPYLLFAVAYVLLFTFAFSSFGNFGIIVRQRVQMFPFVLALLALPPAGVSIKQPPDQDQELTRVPAGVG